MALRTVTTKVNPTPLAQPSLSLVMIARNAAATIGKALSSLDGVADELIVYLAGDSTDDTAQIATDYGATVIQGEWRDDFAWARNQAQGYANGKWLLILDADEALHPDDKDGLREIVNGYHQIVSLTVVSELDDGLIETYGARLMPNSPTIKWESALHEQPIDRSGVLTAINSPVRITHTGYRSEAMTAQNKYDRNIRLASKLAEEHPNNPYYRMFLAQSFQVNGQHLAAVDQYRICVHLCRSFGETPDLVKVFSQAAMGVMAGLNQLGHHKAAAAEGEQASKFVTIRHPGFWLSLGNSYNHLNMGPEAIGAFERSLAHRGNRDIYQVDVGVATWKPYCGLAYALSIVGRMGESLINLRQAFDMCNEEPMRSVIGADLERLDPPLL